MKLQLMIPGLSAYYYDRPTAFPQMTTQVDWSNWGVTESYNMDDSNDASYHTDDSKQQNFDHYFDNIQAWLDTTCLRVCHTICGYCVMKVRSVRELESRIFQLSS